MSRRAWSYIFGVLLLATLLSGLALVYPSPSPYPWLAFAVLVTLGTSAQLFKAEGPNHSAFFATTVFLFAGVLLLPPMLIVLLVAIPLLTEWAKIRLISKSEAHLRAWYIQPFNIAMHTIAGLTARWLYVALDGQSLGQLLPSSILTLLVATISYLLISQFLLGQAFVLARGMSWRESGIMTVENLLPEFMMLCVGASVAMLWRVDPWLILPALAPLVLIYRALMVPKLKEEAQTDGKTGLYNARHFNRRFTEELERARRFDRPLALIMADLDLLRNINNTYGHLAGDIVIEGIGKIIRKTIREYDIAGRFGGEEFAIVLPETGLEQARLLAERIRHAFEECSFEVPTSPTPIRATMSLGVAGLPQDATTRTDLHQAADIAVYQAKYQGRNRVVCAADVPHSVKLERTIANGGEQAAQYAAAFAKKPVDAGTHADATPSSNSGQASTPLVVPGAAAVKSAASATGAAGISSTPAPGPPSRRPSRAVASGAHKDVWLWVFVIGIIMAGSVVAALSSAWSPWPALSTLALLIALTAISEFLQISVYGDNSMSASLALIFAAVFIAGMPGVVAISATIAIVDQIRTGRPLNEFYKVAFNWATHILGGAVPALLLGSISVPINAFNLIGLALMTLIAGLAYYAIDSILISAAISLSKQSNIVRTWQAQFRWLASHYVALSVMGLFLSIAYHALGYLGILVFVLPIFMMRYAQQQYVARTQDSVRELRRMNSELSQANGNIVGANDAIQQLNQRLQLVNDELFVTLGMILDARDPYVGGHAAQVASYAVAIATELGLPPERVALVRQAAYLHDIGKIAIPEHILHKPDKLTDAEYEQIKTHTAIGARLLEANKALCHLAPFVRYHHERWDGRGYPDGLRGEAIPLEARILNICDSVEAMASDRPYHQAMSWVDIIAEIRHGMGTQFDPIIGAAFLRIVENEGAHFIVNSAHTIALKLDIQDNPTSSSKTAHQVPAVGVQPCSVI